MTESISLYACMHECKIEMNDATVFLAEFPVFYSANCLWPLVYGLCLFSCYMIEVLCTVSSLHGPDCSHSKHSVQQQQRRRQQWSLSGQQRAAAAVWLVQIKSLLTSERLISPSLRNRVSCSLLDVTCSVLWCMLDYFLFVWTESKLWTIYSTQWFYDFTWSNRPITNENVSIWLQVYIFS